MYFIFSFLDLFLMGCRKKNMIIHLAQTESCFLPRHLLLSNVESPNCIIAPVTTSVNALEMPRKMPCYRSPLKVPWLLRLWEGKAVEIFLKFLNILNIFGRYWLIDEPLGIRSVTTCNICDGQALVICWQSRMYNCSKSSAPGLAGWLVATVLAGGTTFCPVEGGKLFQLET